LEFSQIVGLPEFFASNLHQIYGTSAKFFSVFSSFQLVLCRAVWRGLQTLFSGNRGGVDCSALEKL